MKKVVRKQRRDSRAGFVLAEESIVYYRLGNILKARSEQLYAY